MIAKKLKRFDMQYRPDWAYNQASMMPADQGRYVEYTDVAGLVESMKEYMRCTSMGFTGPTSQMVNSWKSLRNELARWQS